MTRMTYVGVDVGGERRGFHSVAIWHNKVVAVFASKDPREIAAWCSQVSAKVIAVDCPIGWSKQGRTRQAELELKRRGIQCYSTPTREIGIERGSCGWIRNGQRLFDELFAQFPRYEGVRTGGPTTLETFPHAVICSIAGKVVKAGSDAEKLTNRAATLEGLGYSSDQLNSLDMIDAALCAHVALQFDRGVSSQYGNPEEGHIVLPVALPREP